MIKIGMGQTEENLQPPVAYLRKRHRGEKLGEGEGEKVKDGGERNWRRGVKGK